MTDISPKVLAGGFGAAVATLFWTIATATFWQGVFDETSLTALTGSTAVVVSFVLGYLIRDPARVTATPKVPIPDPGPFPLGPPPPDPVSKEYVDRNQTPPIT